MNPFFRTNDGTFTLYKGDARVLVPKLGGKPFEVVFADPPYFLSNNGFSIQSGKVVSVNKGKWDQSQGFLADAQFNFEWIKACRERMAESGTIWICGTFHNIFSVATILSELNFRILNAITWQKTNPPPNLSCRFFTHSTELLIWARKQKKVAHFFNYDLMHKLAGDRQMTDVWRMSAIAPWEKTCGKHPAQKPVALIVRTLLASSKNGDCILDPFSGSSTTGIAANLIGRRFVGIEQEDRFLNMSRMRRESLELYKDEWRSKIHDLGLLSLGTIQGKENNML